MQRACGAWEKSCLLEEGDCLWAHPLTKWLSFLLQTHSGYFSSLYPHHQFGPFPHHHAVSAPSFMPQPPPLLLMGCPGSDTSQSISTKWPHTQCTGASSLLPVPPHLTGQRAIKRPTMSYCWTMKSFQGSLNKWGHIIPIDGLWQEPLAALPVALSFFTESQDRWFCPFPWAATL
jgi:hypothetical protein